MKSGFRISRNGEENDLEGTDRLGCGWEAGGERVALWMSP